MSEAPLPAATPGDLPYRTIAEMIRAHATARPSQPAVIDAGGVLGYAEFDGLVDRVAAALQRDGIAPGAAIAICAASSARYAAVFVGALRRASSSAARAVVDSRQLASMLADADPGCCSSRERAAGAGFGRCRVAATVALDGKATAWLSTRGSRRKAPVRARSRSPPRRPSHHLFVGPTGEPKGSSAARMRWTHVMRGRALGYSPETVSLLSTPLY